MSLLSLPKLLSFDVKRCALLLGWKCKVSIVQTANITSKEWRDPDVKRPEPYPYKTKKYTFLNALVEGTIFRFDENTKLIVVDGNIGCGKSEFSKQLAEAFDFLHVPEPDISPYYITEYGYDLRKLNPIAPPSYVICDLESFYKNPFHRNVAGFQFRMYMRRLEEYVNALAHMLNTGQGVVMERCAYGDFVFLEAMYKMGCFRKEVRDLYYEITSNSLDQLIRPHLIVYLDVSPEVALERIKKRNNPIEVGSPVLTKEYLGDIETNYKQIYLKEMERHAEVLIYDWSNYGDIEVVVEDIEHIDFERFTTYDYKLSDWRKMDDWAWSLARVKYTTDRNWLVNNVKIFKPRVHEVYHHPEEIEEYTELIRRVPGEEYENGYNPNCGDSVWFKTKKATPIHRQRPRY